MEEVEELLSKDFNHLFSGMKRGQWNAQVSVCWCLQQLESVTICVFTIFIISRLFLLRWNLFVFDIYWILSMILSDPMDVLNIASLY